ncbi:MAG: cation:proton antiporter [Candidatus Binataceae bacterium]
MIPSLYANSFLEDLALVLCVAAVTTVIFHGLRQPVVVGYLVAGMLVGPYTPGIFVDAGRLHGVSELGVILLMFALGLEFSIRRLLRLGPRAAFITAVQVGLMLWLGYVCGRALGWSELESIFTGALLSISSTTIVAKAFAEQRVGADLRELALGVLLCEDLVAVIMLAVLTPLGAGATLNAGALEWTGLRLGLFLLAMVGGGYLVIPPLMRMVARMGRDETLVVASMGICFGFAMEAERAGYSVALGAFLAGSLVAESGVAERLEELVRPLRDVFAAVFFVSVGMMIDPQLIAAHWPALALLVVVLIVGKMVGVTLGAMLAGTSAPLAVQTGLSLAQIGEFSFIIAGVGIETGAAHKFLYSVAVAVSAITTFTTPFMIRACGPVGAMIESRAPHALARLQRVYDGWVERVNAGRAVPDGRLGVAAPLFFLFGGALCVAAVVVAIDIAERPIEKIIIAHGIAVARATTAADLLALAVAVIGTAAMLFGARQLAARLAYHRAPVTGGITLQDWERSVMMEILQLAIMVCAGLLLLAVLQPFLQIREGIAVVVLMASAIALVIWRGARRLAA